MFLGKLDPMEESRLVQLKKNISELQKGKIPTDPVLLRFLRAREFSAEKGREMLSTSLIWRKKHGVDKILSDYQVQLDSFRLMCILLNVDSNMVSSEVWI